MTILPTWDLFVVAFFIIIIAYSFIIGRNATLKVILASYIAILTSNGLGNFMSKFLTDRPFINFFPDNYGVSTLAVFKIAIFIAITLLMVLKGAFSVNTSTDRSNILTFLISLVYGFMSAGLIISTLMIYLTGNTINGILGETASAQNFSNIEFVSPIISSLVNNYSLWFSIPAIVFMIASFINSEERIKEEVVE
jgi:hypothetical protein